MNKIAPVVLGLLVVVAAIQVWSSRGNGVDAGGTVSEQDLREETTTIESPRTFPSLRPLPSIEAPVVRAQRPASPTPTGAPAPVETTEPPDEPVDTTEPPTTDDPNPTEPPDPTLPPTEPPPITAPGSTEPPTTPPPTSGPDPTDPPKTDPPPTPPPTIGPPPTGSDNDG